VMEEKHAISVQNFHEEQTFRDLYAVSGRGPCGRCHNFTECEHMMTFGISHALSRESPWNAAGLVPPRRSPWPRC
jgi:hypothetical protein